LAGSVFFFKSKRRHFNKKNKKKQKSTGLQPGLDRVVGSTCQVSQVTPGVSFLYFFFNPSQFQPRVGRILDRPAGPGF
jgi:hypothetical protein